MKATKELLKKRRKEAKIPFIFWLYFCVQQLFYGWGNYFWIQMKWLCLPDKVLKCVSCFQLDMSIIQCFSHRLLLTEMATRGDTVLHQVWDLGGHVHYLLTVKGKRVHLVSNIKLKSERISFFFLSYASPYLNLILFLSYFFSFFSVYYKYAKV